MLLVGLLGAFNEHAYANRVSPFLVSRLVSVHCVHPWHRAVAVQCVELVLLGLLATGVCDAPEYGGGYVV